MTNMSGIPKSEIGIRGNIPTFGKVILYDDLEGILKWVASGTPVGYAVTKDTSVLYTKGAALKCVSDDGTPADGDKVIAYRYLYLKGSKRLRFECMFHIPSLTVTDEIDFLIGYADTDDTYYAVLRYLASGAKWQYQNSGGTYTDITGGAQTLYGTVWNYVKLEVDFEAEEYLRMQCNHLAIELKDIGLYLTGSGGAEMLWVNLESYAAGATKTTMYYDEILITEVE